MTFRTALVLICCTLAACGRAPEPSKPTAAAPSDHDTAQHDDPNVVEVDDGMLRDLRITTRPVESRPSGERVLLLGELSVDERAYAEVSTPVAARVTRLLATVGDSVTRGQALAELVSPELGRDKAEYLSAMARLRLAEAALERKRTLAEEKIAPLREVQEAESAAGEARAAVRASRAAIAAFGVQPPADDGNETTASTFTITTPVGGSVIERTAVVGQMLDPAITAFKVGNLSTLWLTVHAFERDAVRIREGVGARLTFAALPGENFDGRVTLVGRQVDRQSRTVPIRIDVRNSDHRLRPGMAASAAVPVGAADASVLTVPVAAVQRVRNEWCVFLPKDVRHFEIRSIGRGRDLAEEVEVLSGLRAGELVVVDGAFLLKAQAETAAGGHDGHQ
jgi:cobalt-zinc-cadmium efflux system membrane fusion protein